MNAIQRRNVSNGFTPFWEELEKLHSSFGNLWIIDHPYKDISKQDIKLKETDANIEVLISVPGLNKEQIDVEIDGNNIVVSSEQKTEFSRSTFYKSITLPSNVNTNDVKASCKDGILLIKVPKIKKETVKVKIE